MAPSGSLIEIASVHLQNWHAETDTKVPIKRKRQGKPKVKTGCQTCKIRRIKCDEGKPNCIKCVSTGRTCDGYASPKVVQDAVVWGKQLTILETQNPYNPLLNFPGTRMEHRYLGFFIERTASALSGSFESRFWKGLLPQVSHSEPTIQHAMMAVAALHERFETSGDLIFDPATGSGNFALQQYNKAISCLTKRLNEGPQSEEVTLMCCILFITLDYLRGNVTSAINHLRSGNSILSTWRENEGYPIDEALCERSHPNSISANLSEIFTRITVQSLLCGHPSTARLPGLAEVDAAIATITIPTFYNLHEARVQMDYILKVTLRFLCLAGKLYYAPDGPEKRALERPRLELLSIIDSWSTSFKSMLADTTLIFKPEDLRCSSIMGIQIIIGQIWLGSTLTRNELHFDSIQFENLFREAIKLASAINGNPNTGFGAPHINSLFSFDMGIIPTLYFIAIKCRIPSTRRAALGLLATTLPRREGLWDATIAGTVAARVIEIEEDDLANVGFVHTSDPDGERRPPEHKRVIETVINRHEDEDMDCASKERMQKVTFVLTPDGPAGKWLVRKEILFWKREEQGWKPRHKILGEEKNRVIPPHASMLGHWVPGFFP